MRSEAISPLSGMVGHVGAKRAPIVETTLITSGGDALVQSRSHLCGILSVSFLQIISKQMFKRAEVGGTAAAVAENNHIGPFIHPRENGKRGLLQHRIVGNDVDADST